MAEHYPPSIKNLAARPILDTGGMTIDYVAEAPASAEPRVPVLLVRLGDRHYGLPLEFVERVMPMAEVLSVPEMGDGLLGMLNVHGQVLPVINAHTRLGLPTPPLSAEQRLVLLRASYPFLMWVDEVEQVVVSDANALSVVPGHQASQLVSRVLRLGETIVPLLAPAGLAPRTPS